MYDVIIIGAGPAGISASLYTKRANLNVLVLYYGESNLEQATKIDNYYGFENGITGKQLLDLSLKFPPRTTQNLIVSGLLNVIA